MCVNVMTGFVRFSEVVSVAKCGALCKPGTTVFLCKSATSSMKVSSVLLGRLQLLFIKAQIVLSGRHTTT